MRLFASALVWSGAFRFGLFWIIVGTALAFIATVIPFANWSLVFSVMKDVGAGDISRVADKTFAFGLSSAIVQFALALAIGFFIAHVLLLRAALYDGKRELRRTRDTRDFAGQFDKISGSLRRNAIPEEKPSNVVNLMDAPREGLKTNSKRPHTSGASRKKSQSKARRGKTA